MRKTDYLILLITLIFTACSNSAEKNEATEMPSVSKAKDNVKVVESQITPDIEKSASDNNAEVIEADKWSHPAKDVLLKYKAKIIKVELLKEKTYPVFHVELPNTADEEAGQYLKNLTSELALANGYWDYLINDVKNSMIIDVKCDKKVQSVVDVTVNGDKGFVSKSGDTSTNVSWISRKEAGLSTIPPMEFTNFQLNNRIKELLFNPVKYEDNDYVQGIVQYNGILISERFKDKIIEDIKTGTSTDKVKSVLGNPNIIERDFFFYKTKEYYIGFKGNQNVEYAFLCKRDLDYSKDILKLTINELTSNSSKLMETVTNNKELRDFFDSNGHIHGGGWYANSTSGIEIIQFDENSITVYNNFEGNLPQIENFDYKISCNDKDYQVEKSIMYINSYIADNKEFNSEGVLSPSSRLKAKFFWGHSECHYFTIRTLDNSKPDFRVGAPAGEFRWLTDDYILYLNAWTFAPYVIDVRESSENKEINVMYNVGVFPKDDYFQDFDTNYAIKDIRNNNITFLDEGQNKEYRVEYSINKDKKITFKLLK